jgi:hypothetical protein
LIGRWSLYTQGEYAKDMTGYFLSTSEVTEISRQASRKVFTDAFLNTLSKYEELGVNVVIVLQVPQQKTYPKNLYSKIYASNVVGLDESDAVVQKLSVGYADHLLLQEFNRQFFESIKGKDSVKFFNPDPYFCDDTRCSLGNSKMSFYRDDDHLNSYGSYVLEEGLSEFLKQ